MPISCLITDRKLFNTTLSEIVLLYKWGVLILANIPSPAATSTSSPLRPPQPRTRGISERLPGGTTPMGSSPPLPGARMCSSTKARSNAPGPPYPGGTNSNTRWVGTIHPKCGRWTAPALVAPMEGFPYQRAGPHPTPASAVDSRDTMSVGVPPPPRCQGQLPPPPR